VRRIRIWRLQLPLSLTGADTTARSGKSQCRTPGELTRLLAVMVTGLSIAALGIGATFVTAFTASLTDAAPAEGGLRSALVNTFHELGGPVGAGVAQRPPHDSAIRTPRSSAGGPG
jgi:hypothetical protein